MAKKKKRKERISLEESAKKLQEYINKYKDWKPPETRGVKPGTKRGKYKPRKTGQIQDKKFIIFKCKTCGREVSYKRIGKRKRESCSEKCRQKYYRWTKKLKEIERKKKLLKQA